MEELFILLGKYIDPTVLAISVIGLMWLPAIIPAPTADSSKWYRWTYTLINNIAANVGKAKNANHYTHVSDTSPKASDTSSKTLKSTMLVLLTFSLLSVSGCALKGLETHEQGIAVTQELTKTYYAMEDQYFKLPEKVQDEVAPLLDNYRHTLVLLRDSASLWYKNKAKPIEFDVLVQDITNIINDIKVIINRIT